LAILIGRDMSRFLSRELSPRVDAAFAWIFRICCASGCVFPVLLLVGIDRHTHVPSPPIAYAVAAAAAITMVLSLVLISRGQRPAALAAGVLWFGVLFVAVMTWPMQTIAAQLSQKALAKQVAASPHLPRQVILVGQHVGSIIFYLPAEQRRTLLAQQI